MNMLILTDELPSLEAQKKAPISAVDNLKRISIEKRKEFESAFIKRYMEVKTRLNFFVDEDWIDAYLKFLNGQG